MAVAAHINFTGNFPREKIHLWHLWWRPLHLRGGCYARCVATYGEAYGGRAPGTVGVPRRVEWLSEKYVQSIRI